MAAFNDTFTEGVQVALAGTHVADSGEAWSVLNGTAANIQVLTSGKVRGPTTASQELQQVAYTPASADYDVVITFYVQANSNGMRAGGRAVASTGYFLAYDTGSLLLRVYKAAASLAGATVIGSTAVTLPSVTSTKTFTLRFTGNIIKVLDSDGITELISIDETANTPITAAGKIAVWAPNLAFNVSRMLIDSITSPDPNAKALVGSTAGTSVLTGAAVTTKALAGTSAAVATVAGTLSVASSLRPLAGTIATFSGLELDFRAPVPPVGILEGSFMAIGGIS